MGKREGLRRVRAGTSVREPIAPPGFAPYGRAMDSSRDHFAILTTLRGSVVSLPNLTEEQAAAVAAQHEPPVAYTPPAEASDDTEQCGRCSGAGGWNEPVEVETGSGGKVVTQKWVRCRPCGGTGRVPA